MQQKEPDDFVISTNETHSVREFIEHAFSHIGTTIKWEGEGVDEKGIDINSGKLLVKINPKFFRPGEVDLLIGDYSKAKKILGWEPKIKFNELVKIMVEKDIERISKI